MIINNSRRRYFKKPNGDKDFVGRLVNYRDGGENKEIFIKADELKEDISHSDLEAYLEDSKGE